MGVKTYDPNEVTVIVGGFTLSGFADGTKVTCERMEPGWSLQIGTDGEGTRSKSNNKSGAVTIVLMQTSDSNDILSAIAAADEYGNAGLRNVLVKDAGGRTVFEAETAWVERYPTSEFGREATGREWVLHTDTLVVFVGGNG